MPQIWTPELPKTLGHRELGVCKGGEREKAGHVLEVWMVTSLISQQTPEPSGK